MKDLAVSLDPNQVSPGLLGFIIVGLFLATWAIAVSWWRLGHVEERWSRHLANDR